METLKALRGLQKTFQVRIIHVDIVFLPKCIRQTIL